MDIGAVERHGRLSVKDGRLTDKHGKAVRLIGVSTHGIAWYPRYICRETLEYIVREWGINCIRFALYTREYGGYCSGGDKADLRELILKGCGIAAELGIYAIIDWHVLSEKDPNVCADEAEEFFADMSSRLAGRDNIIYEICNEPNADSDHAAVTRYARRIIPVIRRNAPESVILVGSPTWSQDIHLAAEQPLPFENIMYTFHFYAATHGQYLRERVEECVKNGLPVFVSEYGMCASDGGGELDEHEAREWLTLLDRYGISMICWNLSDDDESAAFIRHGCEKLSGWSAEELTPHGRFFLESGLLPAE